MIKRTLALFALLLLVSHGLAQSRVPTLDDLLTLKSIGGAQISPDGKWVAYTVSYADFKQDAFVTQIWLVNSDTGKSFQLTRGDKSSTGPRWAPDGRLSFLSNRVEDKNQIFLIDPNGGEAQQLSKSETAINNFAWSDDGKTIAYTATEPTAQPLKDRKEQYGDYEVVRAGYSFVHIWTLDVAEALKSPVAGKQRTKKTDFSVESFSWAPDGSTIVFSATLNPDLIQGTTGDIYLLKLGDDSVKKIVDQPGPTTIRASRRMENRSFSLRRWVKNFSSRATSGWRLWELMAASQDRLLTILMRFRVYSNGTATESISTPCRRPLRTCTSSIR